jgi:hypothetical protein
MLQLDDDPDHKRLRGLVSQAFNQRSVDACRPRIRAIADALLDALAGGDLFDVIAEYASPLPIIVIAEMLGVDPGDMPQFKRWSDARAHLFNPARTPEQAEALIAAGRGLQDYFARAIEARRGRAGADLISMLVDAEEAGDRLSAPEIVGTCNLLLVAGNLTTTDLIGNGVFALLQHPDQLAKLCAHPELATNAVESGRRPANVHAVTAARGHAECTGCAERRSGLIGRSRRWGLTRAGWSRGRASANVYGAVFDPDGTIDPQLGRPDPSTPLGSPVPANCPAGAPSGARGSRAKWRMRAFGTSPAVISGPRSPAGAVRCMNVVASRRGHRPTLTGRPGMTPILLARCQCLA